MCYFSFLKIVQRESLTASNTGIEYFTVQQRELISTQKDITCTQQHRAESFMATLTLQASKFT